MKKTKIAIMESKIVSVRLTSPDSQITRAGKNNGGVYQVSSPGIWLGAKRQDEIQLVRGTIHRSLNRNS